MNEQNATPKKSVEKVITLVTAGITLPVTFCLIAMILIVSVFSLSPYDYKHIIKSDDGKNTLMIMVNENESTTELDVFCLVGLNENIFTRMFAKKIGTISVENSYEPYDSIGFIYHTEWNGDEVVLKYYSERVYEDRDDPATWNSVNFKLQDSTDKVITACVIFAVLVLAVAITAVVLKNRMRKTMSHE